MKRGSAVAAAESTLAAWAGPHGPPRLATDASETTTDATLTKGQAKRLAIMAHDGLARAVLPAHAPLDGDTIFAAATGFG